MVSATTTTKQQKPAPLECHISVCDFIGDKHFTAALPERLSGSGYISCLPTSLSLRAITKAVLSSSARDLLIAAIKVKGKANVYLQAKSWLGDRMLVFSEDLTVVARCIRDRWQQFFFFSCDPHPGSFVHWGQCLTAFLSLLESHFALWYKKKKTLLGLCNINYRNIQRVLLL